MSRVTDSDRQHSARHVKCDEAPDICNNCRSTGRKCEGYDLCRLTGTQLPVTCLPGIATRLGWIANAEEKRYFSYFTNCSIPNLETVFNSPLWRRLVLQISQTDRAVYHAANALGALHEDSGQNQMRVSGENLRRHHHRFALEQAARAVSYLRHRQASQDPEYCEVLLLCCLLFILCDLILGQYEKAFQHLRNGLQILEERNRQQPSHLHSRSFDTCLVQTFRRLEVEASHFGAGPPSLFLSTELELAWLNQNVSSSWNNLRDVYRDLDSLLGLGIPFLAKCWLLSSTQIESEYEKLFHMQHWLLSRYCQLQNQIEAFGSHHSIQFSPGEYRGLEILRIQCLGQILALRTCLIDGPVPAEFIPDYVGVLSVIETFMAKFPGRPTFTLDYGVIPTLYVVASRCPQYLIRLQAINLIISWPHCEGLVNSNVAASLALKTLKSELQINNQEDISLVDQKTDVELKDFLINMLSSTEGVANWSTIRAARVLQQ